MGAQVASPGIRCRSRLCSTGDRTGAGLFPGQVPLRPGPSTDDAIPPPRPSTRWSSTHLETFLALAHDEDPTGWGVPSRVERDFRCYPRCGALAHGLARVRCGDCGHERLLGDLHASPPRGDRGHRAKRSPATSSRTGLPPSIPAPSRNACIAGGKVPASPSRSRSAGSTRRCPTSSTTERSDPSRSLAGPGRIPPQPPNPPSRASHRPIPASSPAVPSPPLPRFRAPFSLPDHNPGAGRGIQKHRTPPSLHASEGP